MFVGKRRLIIFQSIIPTIFCSYRPSIMNFMVGHSTTTIVIGLSITSFRFRRIQLFPHAVCVDAEKCTRCTRIDDNALRMFFWEICEIEIYIFLYWKISERFTQWKGRLGLSNCKCANRYCHGLNQFWCTPLRTYFKVEQIFSCLLDANYLNVAIRGI